VCRGGKEVHINLGCQVATATKFCAMILYICVPQYENSDKDRWRAFANAVMNLRVP
jgi:hypothetical protein